MKPFFKTTILATSLILALTTACSNDKRDKKDATTVKLSNQMKADELTNAGEQLVSPYTFMLADKVFDMALEKDSSNQKAQFYKLFVARMMVFKGIARRISPMVKNGSPEQKADYAKWMKEFPESPLKTFLLDGTEDIDSPLKAARVLSDYNQALNNFRVFLKKNPTMELTLNLNPHVFEKEINDELANSCTWKDVADGAVEVTCDPQGIAQKKMNSADLIALRQVTGGEMLYWSMFTAYDLTVSEQISKNENLQNMAPQEVLAYYKSLPSLGKLNPENTLHLIPEIGSDFSASVKWYQQYQDRVCPKGAEVSNQRRGYLFKNGICIERSAESDKSLAAIDKILGGVFTQPIENEKGEQVDQIRVNLVGFLKNLPQDLKHFLPESVDQNGQNPRWSDPTMNGLFPDGDIKKILVISTGSQTETLELK